MGSEIADWLEGVRQGFSKFSPVLEQYGAESTKDLKLLEDDDVEVLQQKMLAAEPPPPPLHVRLVVSELRRLVGQPISSETGAADPHEAAAESSDDLDYASSDESKSEEEMAQGLGWQSEPGSSSTASAACRRKTVARRQRSRAGKNAAAVRVERAQKGTSLPFPSKRQRNNSKDRRGVDGQTTIFSMFQNSPVQRISPVGQRSITVLSSDQLPDSGCSRDRCTLNEHGEVTQPGMILECGEVMSKLLEGSRYCLLKPNELSKSGRDPMQERFSFPKLRNYFLRQAFDICGRPRVHLQCMQVPDITATHARTHSQPDLPCPIHLLRLRLEYQRTLCRKRTASKWSKQGMVR